MSPCSRITSAQKSTSSPAPTRTRSTAQAISALDTIPVVIQVPDFGNRFYTYQIADARTNSFGQIGKQYGTKPGFYALVGPNWKGTIPAGITGVLHSPTDLVAIFPRVFQDDTPEDKAAIQPLLNQIVVYPLSEFDGKMKTMDWKKTPDFPAPPSTGGETKWVIPEKFFDELPIILKQVPPMPGEEALYATFQSVLDAAAKDPKLKQVLTQTAVAAEKEVVCAALRLPQQWKARGQRMDLAVQRRELGLRLSLAAATAKSNMYDNAPQRDALHLHGLRFDESAPQWRPCLHSDISARADAPRRWLLVAHPLQQRASFRAQSLGPLLARHQEQVDEAECRRLAHHLRAEHFTGGGKETNWLPAPKDDFSLYIRAYWPKAEITEGKWIPPHIERAK